MSPLAVEPAVPALYATDPPATGSSGARQGAEVPAIGAPAGESGATTGCIDGSWVTPSPWSRGPVATPPWLQADRDISPGAGTSGHGARPTGISARALVRPATRGHAVRSAAATLGTASDAARGTTSPRNLARINPRVDAAGCSRTRHAATDTPWPPISPAPGAPPPPPLAGCRGDMTARRWHRRVHAGAPAARYHRPRSQQAPRRPTPRGRSPPRPAHPLAGIDPPRSRP